MGKVPKQRGGGQRGGGGYTNHGPSMGRSSARGGRPHAGGGGSKNNGCAVAAIALIGLPLAAGWGLIEAIRAVVS